jgi:hypothetical protein
VLSKIARLCTLAAARANRHDLDDGNRPHQQHLGRIVHAWAGDLDLFRHRHDGGGYQQDFDPRDPVSAKIEECCSRIREENLPEDEQRQNVNEARYQTKKRDFYGNVPCQSR